MRARTVSLNEEKIDVTFEEFIKLAPKEIQLIIKKCKTVPQTLKWHPENWVYDHIKIVFNRARRDGDINLMIAALFHDLGKADVTKKHPTKPGAWSAHGHEKISAQLVKKYSDWIEEMGGNPEIVYYIVDQHMRIQQYPNMKPSKQEKFRQQQYYNLVHQFSKYDNMLTDYKNDID